MASFQRPDDAHSAVSGLSALERFPPELLVQCVEWLDQDPITWSEWASEDRIHASQVSKSWRNTLVSAPHLWTTIDLTRLSHATAANWITTLLERSAPLEVHLRVGLAGASETALIQANIARFASLRLKWRLEPEDALLTSKWPRLRRLDCQNAIIYFPENWGGDHMPLLEELVLRSFILPDDVVPLTALHTFHARMGLFDGEYSDARLLFQLCPNLVNLELTEVSSSELLPQGTAPRTLRNVRLISYYGQAIDLSDYLRPWAGGEFSYIYLQPSVAAVPFELFAQSHDNPWRLTMSSQEFRPAVFEAEEIVASGAVKSRLLIETALDDVTSLSVFAGIELQLSRLTVLSMSGFPALAFLRAGLTLPSLVDLTQRDTAAFEHSDIRLALELEQPERALIRVPALRHLTFDLTSPWFDGEGSEQDSRTFISTEPSQLTAAHLQSYVNGSVLYETPRLETLTVTGHAEDALRWAGLHVLTVLATSIYVQHKASDSKELLFQYEER